MFQTNKVAVNWISFLAGAECEISIAGTKERTDEAAVGFRLEPPRWNAGLVVVEYATSG